LDTRDIAVVLVSNLLLGGSELQNLIVNITKFLEEDGPPYEK